jgi:hypothetical protein
LVDGLADRLQLVDGQLRQVDFGHDYVRVMSAGEASWLDVTIDEYVLSAAQ